MSFMSGCSAEEHHRRGAGAKVRLAGYEPRLGETFPLQGEAHESEPCLPAPPPRAWAARTMQP